MPFTISHAAAVLPFIRPLARWRLLSAAVIGSMVPDFGWCKPQDMSQSSELIRLVRDIANKISNDCGTVTAN